METKELIQEAALDLFAQNGYESSSVRDIAARIGIKDSSLYFHYKNKQAILDSLTGRFITISEQMMSLLDDITDNITTMDDESFCTVTEQYIQRYFMNDFISKFIMVMNHERSHNEPLRQQYIQWCVNKPVEFQTKVMAKLQEIGYLRYFDVHYIALNYYGPIFLFFNQYIHHDYTVEDKELFKASVMAATRNFISIYAREK